MNILEFEKPIVELELKIEELKTFGIDKNIALGPEIKKLEEKLERMRTEIYSRLTVWQRVQIARHPDRPYTLDYIRMMTTGFIELHGDRQFADDLALIAGFAHLDGIKVLILGHQKGRDVKENVLRNFGCAHPAGYRKAMRLMLLLEILRGTCARAPPEANRNGMRLMGLTEKFPLPIVVLSPPPGGYPGVGAEE